MATNGYEKLQVMARRMCDKSRGFPCFAAWHMVSDTDTASFTTVFNPRP